jgi:hypothetical protein
MQRKLICHPRNMMCEERVVGLQSILQSLATKVPRIILQRVEEMFPTVRESMGVFCECDTHTHTHTHTRTRTHTHSLSLSHTHTLSLSLSLTHTHTLSLSLSLSYPIFISCTFALTVYVFPDKLF